MEPVRTPWRLLPAVPVVLLLTLPGPALARQGGQSLRAITSGNLRAMVDRVFDADLASLEGMTKDAGALGVSSWPAAQQEKARNFASMVYNFKSALKNGMAINNPHYGKAARDRIARSIDNPQFDETDVAYAEMIRAEVNEDDPASGGVPTFSFGGKSDPEEMYSSQTYLFYNVAMTSKGGAAIYLADLMEMQDPEAFKSARKNALQYGIAQLNHIYEGVPSKYVQPEIAAGRDRIIEEANGKLAAVAGAADHPAFAAAGGAAGSSGGAAGGGGAGGGGVARGADKALSEGVKRDFEGDGDSLGKIDNSADAARKAIGGTDPGGASSSGAAGTSTGEGSKPGESGVGDPVANPLGVPIISEITFPGGYEKVLSAPKPGDVNYPEYEKYFKNSYYRVPDGPLPPGAYDFVDTNMGRIPRLIIYGEDKSATPSPPPPGTGAGNQTPPPTPTPSPSATPQTDTRDYHAMMDDMRRSALEERIKQAQGETPPPDTRPPWERFKDWVGEKTGYTKFKERLKSEYESVKDWWKTFTTAGGLAPDENK